MLELHAEEGSSIEKFASDLLVVANVIEVVGVFNHIRISVDKNDTVKSITNKYSDFERFLKRDRPRMPDIDVDFPVGYQRK